MCVIVNISCECRPFTRTSVVFKVEILNAPLPSFQMRCDDSPLGQGCLTLLFNKLKATLRFSLLQFVHVTAPIFADSDFYYYCCSISMPYWLSHLMVCSVRRFPSAPHHCLGLCCTCPCGRIHSKSQLDRFAHARIS